MKYNTLIILGLIASILLTNGCKTWFTQTCELSDEPPDPAVTRVKCPENTLHPNTEKWQPLFDQNLSNALFPANTWFYNERGELTATRDEAIWSKAMYENFILDLEYTFDEDANSGVLIYCQSINNWIPNSVEIQILDDNYPGNRDISPFTKNSALFGHLAPMVNNVKPVGEWNRMTITAQGSQLKVVVNGELTLQADLSEWTSATKNPDGSDIPVWLSRAKAELPTKGHIGLQGKHGKSAIYFRNVRINQL